MDLHALGNRGASGPEAPEPEEPHSEATIRDFEPLADAGNHRDHSRFSVALDVTVGSEHNFYAGFAENLSAGGVFVATHQLKPVGSKIELSISLPGGSQVRGAGEVRWVRIFNERSDTPPGMGVRFAELDPESLEAVTKFLEHRQPLFFDED